MTKQLHRWKLVAAWVVWVALIGSLLSACADMVPVWFRDAHTPRVNLYLVLTEMGDWRPLHSGVPGLLPTDAVVQVDDTVLSRDLGWAKINELLRGPLGSRVTLRVRSHDGHEKDITVLRRYYLPFLVDFYSGVLCVFGSLLLALLLVWKRPKEGYAILASLALVLFSLVRYAPGYVAGVAMMLAPLTVLMFPDGRFKPRWSWLIGLVFAANFAGRYTLAESSLSWFWDGPWGDLVSYSALGGVLLAQIWRYRHHADPAERAQIRWIIYGFSAALAFRAVILLGDALRGSNPTDPVYSSVWFWTASVAINWLYNLAVPFAMTVALVRYRLWNISVVVNRTVVYGVVSGVLAAVFVGVLVAFQALFRLVTGTGDNVAAAVISTAVIAVLFQPLRGRVQALIDKRFFRNKVDLAQRVMAFARQVRGMLDLQELLRSLVRQMDEMLNMQHGAVYLRRSGQLERVEGTGPLPPETETLALSRADRQRIWRGQAVADSEQSPFPLMLPLMAAQEARYELVGVLALGPKQSGAGYSSDERALLEGLVEQAGTAVHVAQLVREKRRYDELLTSTIDLAVLLAAEKQFDRLLERILIEAKNLANAETGILYLCREDHLDDVVVRNDRLGLALGGESGNPADLAHLPLACAEGEMPYLSAEVVRGGEAIHVPDARLQEGAPLRIGHHAFAEQGYQMVSALCLPLKDSLNRAIGTLELINARDAHTQEVVAFNPGLQQVMVSLATLAGLTLASYLREEKLRTELDQLRVEVDRAKVEHEVSQITESEFFQDLKQRAQSLRRRPGRAPAGS